MRFDGRFDTSDPKGPRFAWSASAMKARFRGTEATLRLSDTSTPVAMTRRNRYTVVVDGKATTLVPDRANGGVYRLARGLAPGAHDVTVFRNTEAQLGDAQFLGFDFGAGGELLAPPTAARRIEMIGDSITSGYGNEGADGSCHYTAQTQNAYMTYGAIAARALDAALTIVAYSAIGIYRNNDGGKQATMPVRYMRTFADRPSPAWDFASAPPPDVVVVNLGTNDFAPGVPDETAFVTAYRAFVELVRRNAPRAHVFCAVGPMLSDTYPPGQTTLSIARRYVQRVVGESRDAGDARVHFLELAPMNVAKHGAGCDFHPSVKTHALMAETLVAEIRAKLKW